MERGFLLQSAPGQDRTKLCTMAKKAIVRWLVTLGPFVAFCLLVSSRWLLESAYPPAASTQASEAVGCLLVAGILVSWSQLPRSRKRVSAAQQVFSWKLCFAAAAAVSGPAVISLVADRHVSGENATLALALTPVVVAVASSVLGEAIDDDFAARLWPGLAGVAGLLLLLPQPRFSSWRFDLALGLMPFTAGVSASWVSQSLFLPRPVYLRVSPRFPWVAPSLGFAATVFGALALRGFQPGTRPVFSLSAAALDGLTFWLSLSVLGRLGAVCWSAQFLVIPLLTLIQGVLFLRPVLDARSWLAFVLLAGSGGYLFTIGRAGRGGADSVMVSEPDTA